MKKIPTLYRRDPDHPKYVTDEVTFGCEWVLRGEGTPTRKYDGTCVMLDEEGKWWARREVRPGKSPPDNFVPVTTDDDTGKVMGWEPIAQSSFAKFHTEAEEYYVQAPGTYELIGPKVNGNPENVEVHMLIPHGMRSAGKPDTPPRVLMSMCDERGWEGIVWWHPDGRKAKLKVRDIQEKENGR